MFRSVFLIISLLYIIDMLLLVPKYVRCKYDHTPRKRKLFWKGACIGLPFLILAFGTLVISVFGYAKGNYSYLLVTAGMLFCAVGDITLDVRFSVGGIFFGIGHLFYIAAMFFLNTHLFFAPIICYVILVVLGTALTIKYLGRKYRVKLIVYNIIISASFALGIGLILSGDPGQILLGYGCVALVISDWLLARNKIFGSSYAWSMISLSCYFGGQIMISAFPYLI